MFDISVIIPVYNVENYLAECLDSVIAQNEVSIEIICVNDGSTDNSLNILENYAERDERIYIYTQENAGLAAARNSGLARACGTYVCFLDSDDMLTPGALKELFGVASNNAVNFVSYETKIQYDEEELHSKDKDAYYTKHNHYLGVRTGKECFTEMIENGEYTDSACLIFADRKWLNNEGINFYSGIYYEDALFCLKCYMKADRMCHIPLIGYIYRVRKNSIMTKPPKFWNVYSCMVNFRETMRILLDIPETERKLISALVEYMHLIVSKIRYLDDYRIDRDYLPELSDVDSFLEAVFGVGAWRATPYDELLLNGLERIAERSNGIILYGAGEVGRLVLDYLRDMGLSEKVACFAVTNVNDNEKMSCGKEVRSIDEFADGSYQIIMSAGRGIQAEMKKKLAALGIQNYIGIDRYTEGALRKRSEAKTV